MGEPAARGVRGTESPHALERDVGMERYLTAAPGVGGRAKAEPADFAVREVFPVSPSAQGRFMLVELEKEGWETHHMVRDLSRALGISRGRIAYAGVKDKRALTTQIISIEGVEPAQVEAVRLPRLRLRVIGRYTRAVALGEHMGNRFSIRLTGCAVAGGELARAARTATAELAAAGGVPNYFGPQRFGVQRPVNHAVGRLLVCGDPQGALVCFLAMTTRLESEAARTARETFASTPDPRAALGAYPVQLRYERAALHHLAAHPGDWRGALGALGDLGRVFVHAYQSYLFNRALSARLRMGLGPAEPLPGDAVVPLDEHGVPRWQRCATAGAAPADLEFLRRRGRLAVAWPLVGAESALPEGDAGEPYRRVLDEERVSPADFASSAAPEFASRGGMRTLHAAIKDLRAAPEPADGSDLRLEFFLAKGAYATVVLREYTKAEPLSMC